MTAMENPSHPVITRHYTQNPQAALRVHAPTAFFVSCHPERNEVESRDPLLLRAFVVSSSAMKDHNYYVYIMASESGTLYIGMTNDPVRRVFEHKHGLVEGFTKKYNCTKLVYVEHFTDVEDCIAREKQLKNWRREKKEHLIRAMNPRWEDLGEKL